VTTRNAPGAPKLVIDGKPEENPEEPLSDSEWDGLDDTDQTTQNLTKIAQALKNKKGTRGAARTQG